MILFPHPDEAGTALARMQATIPRTQVALDATVVE